MAQVAVRVLLPVASSSSPTSSSSSAAPACPCASSSSFSMASSTLPPRLLNLAQTPIHPGQPEAISLPKSGFLGSWQRTGLQSFSSGVIPWQQQQRRHQGLWKVSASAGPNDGIRWWEKEAGPNVFEIHSTQEFIDALSKAGDKLVVVEFFATWCGSCRALYPKFIKLAAEHTNVQFLKVNFDENKPMCKSLNIKVLPFFHFYRGAEGRLDAFSCSLAKLQRLKEAISTHNTERCSIGPPLGVGDLDLSGVSTSDQPAAAGTSR